MKVNYFSIPEIMVSYKDTVKASERFVVKCSEDASQIFTEAHKDSMEHHEEVNVLFLNRANRVLGISCISKGGLDGTVVDIRIILQIALKANCASVMLSHYHPSSSRKPSHADISITQKLKEGCKAVGLLLLDHLIITSEGYMSFADKGLL